MTAKQKLRAEVDRLTEAEAAAAYLVVRRSEDGVDEWGSLSAFSAALMTDTLERLAEEEQEAGCEPW
jgi:hypothetical protein